MHKLLCGYLECPQGMKVASFIGEVNSSPEKEDVKIAESREDLEGLREGLGNINGGAFGHSIMITVH